MEKHVLSHNDSAPLAAPSPAGRQKCHVFAAEDFHVLSGVNSGDALGTASEVELGDVYEIYADAQALRLFFAQPEGQALPQVERRSDVGPIGAAIQSRARFTFMGDDGTRVEVLLLEIEGAHFALPLSPMAIGAAYSLLHAESAPEDAQLASVMCLSFARGTRLSLADGTLVAVETLRPGMALLTRDHGAQTLRHVGRASLRALGAYAPVVITSGTMGNAGDLIISQQQRMFLYQRERPKGLDRAELLIQARHLVDDERIFIREGGVTDWFTLIFDSHEIIYAEGVPVESLMVTETTIRALPPALAEEMRARFPNLRHIQHVGIEPEAEHIPHIRRAHRRATPPRD